MHCPVAAQHFWPAQNHTPAMTSMHHSSEALTPIPKKNVKNEEISETRISIKGLFHILIIYLNLG